RALRRPHAVDSGQIALSEPLTDEKLVLLASKLDQRNRAGLQMSLGEAQRHLGGAARVDGQKPADGFLLHPFISHKLEYWILGSRNVNGLDVRKGSLPSWSRQRL